MTDETIDVEFEATGPVVIHAHRTAVLHVTIVAPKPPTPEQIIDAILVANGFNPEGVQDNAAARMFYNLAVRGKMSKSQLLHNLKNVSMLDAALRRW